MGKRSEGENVKKKIAVLPGDGIGEEVMEQALRVLAAVADRFGHVFDVSKGLIGGAAYDEYRKHFPEETRKLCEQSDAILFGSVGGPVSQLHREKWNNCERNTILELRKTFAFNANFRAVKMFPELAGICPLKKEIVERGVDILFVRELVGDIYFGEHKTFVRDGMRVATDVAKYTEKQIASVAETAFVAAGKRRRKVTSVDKANVLDTSRLWRVVVREVARRYPDVELEDMLVDNCAMQIIRDPSQFDVVLTGNMFGDILSDAVAILPGSLGLLASASLNEAGFGMFEPPGGSAQDIAGQGIANPIGQILSVAMMLRHAFSLLDEADCIENAVSEVLKAGYRTRDIAQPSDTPLGTVEMADGILSSVRKP